MALGNYFTQDMYSQTGQLTSAQPGYNPNVNPSGVSTIQGALAGMTDPNSAYMRNAAQQGKQLAAQRGGINSSIAAGAAQRSALEAAAPLAQQAVAIDQTREGRLADEWASTQNFNRAMLGQYSQSAFSNSLNMLNMVQQMGMQDPELYTPEVLSGYTNFFQKNMNDMLKRYFS